MSRKKPLGNQLTLDGGVVSTIEVARKPHVIEQDGLKVVHVVLSPEDLSIKGVLEQSLQNARRLAPEVKSKGKPPWMTAAWQAKRRKMREAG